MYGLRCSTRRTCESVENAGNAIAAAISGWWEAREETTPVVVDMEKLWAAQHADAPEGAELVLEFEDGTGSEAEDYEPSYAIQL
jgi:hypothetical protein